MNNHHNFDKPKVVLISTAHLIHDIFSSFLPPILPLLIEKLSFSYTMAGLLTVAQRLPSLLNPLMGLWADRVDSRILLITAPAITSVAMSLLGVAPSYGILFILLILMGIGSTCFHVPAPVLIRSFSGKRVGTGMSYFMLGGELARTVGPMVILGAVSLWGLEGSWKLISFGLSASFLLFIKLRNVKTSVRQKDKTQRKSIKTTIKKLLPFLLILWGYTFFRTIMKTGFTIFLPTFLTGKGQSIYMGGVSLSILELSGAAGTFFGGWFSDHIGRRNMLLIGAVASPGLGWIFLYTKGTISLIVLLLLGFFLFAAGPVLLALVQDVKAGRPAFLNGLYMTMNFLSTSITALLVGWGGDIFGLEVTFKIIFTLSMLAIPFIWFLSEKHLKIE